MPLTLYFMEVSHPSQAARLMLDHKGLTYRRVDIRPGFQPLVTRLHRFRGITVPALMIGERRVQGSMAIARALDDLKPDPPLYPADPDLRRAVQVAEAWAERELQPIPRNIFRWALAAKPELLPRFVADLQRLRPAGLIARLEAPAVRRFSRAYGGTEAQVRAGLRALPGLLDRVEALLADQVVGRPERNAADFQIATTLRVMSGLEDLRPLIEGRPIDAYSRSIWAGLDTRFPPVVPASWMPPAPVASSA